MRTSQGMPEGIFITGTDTGVGKTFISVLLTQALAARGINVGVMKPIETGCILRQGALIPQDACRLKKAAGVPDPLDLINPYRFRPPLAPWPASLIEQKKIEMNKIVSAYKRLKAKHTFILVEGIGGVRVPLTAKLEVMHLIKRLDLPVLLVARAGLGTLNHTLLTLHYGIAHGIRFEAVLLNTTQPVPTAADRTNRAVLEKKISIPIIGPFPYMKRGREKNAEKALSELRALPIWEKIKYPTKE